MLKSLKNKENISLDKELLKPHENSKKIYVKSQRFKDVSVPMDAKLKVSKYRDLTDISYLAERDILEKVKNKYIVGLHFAF